MKINHDLFADGIVEINNDLDHQLKSKIIDDTSNGSIFVEEIVDDPDDKKLLRKLDLYLIP
ncbi:unnamed protein product, partial [Adineta steineri]